MRRFTLALIFLLSLTVVVAQETSVVITLKSGDKVTGVILEENENIVRIKTPFGELDIPREDILLVKPVEELGEPKEDLEQEMPSELNQEARWRTIWSAMGIGNFLYGFGVPYVLGIDDLKLATGIRLLMFAGGFYASWRYTKNMDLPLGRWQFQMTGAQLGGSSLLPIMAIVGFENWSEFDKDGKIALTYLMAAVPFGVWKADQFYKVWKLSNGQASIISQSTYLGAFNTIGIINLIHSNDWDWSENLLRFYTCLTYSGSIAGGYYAKKYVTRKSYTEDDALFLTISAGVGLANSLILINLLEVDERKPVTLFLMAGVNGFSLLADRLNKDNDIKKGMGRIIGLGTIATYLAWLGTAAILDIDYDTKFARTMDLASITSGWYLTYRWVSGSGRLGYKRGKMSKFTITPAVFANRDSIYPGMKLQAFF